MKKSCIALIGLLFLFGCEKEYTDGFQEEQFETLEAGVIQDRASVEKETRQKMNDRIKAIMLYVSQSIEKLKSERSHATNDPSFIEKRRWGKPVIHIPADYPSLQEAVDNAKQGSKILVKGEVSDMGDVLVDVPKLTIQGTGKSASISGDRLIIMAAGVEVKNLAIDMAIVVSGTEHVTLFNNKINGSANFPGYVVNGLAVNMAVLLEFSSDCSLKNNQINPKDNNLAIHFGIMINGGSGHDIKLNRISFDHSLIPNTVFFEGIHGFNGTNNNKFSLIKIESNINSASSFGIYLESSDNKVSHCKATNFSGAFALFGNNNEVINCVSNQYAWSGVEINGNDNKVKFCRVNGEWNGETGLRGFASFFGENNSFENCFTRNNEMGMQMGSDQATIREYHISRCIITSNNIYGVYIYNAELCRLEKSVVQTSGDIGINLVGVTETEVSRNRSKNNTNCDFNQTNTTDITSTGNQFGTECMDLPWVGPI